MKINISGNAGSASKVNNLLTIGEQTFDGSQAVTISASTLATLLDAYASAYIDTSNLRDLSVTSGKIGKGAVIRDKLADGAVDTNALADNGVTYAKLDGEEMKSRLLRIGTGNRAPKTEDASSFDLWVQWF
nr:MAG TPA: Dec protein, OB-Fold, Decoration, VIRAL PROTEIN [Caudoviricetes sp.]